MNSKIKQVTGEKVIVRPFRTPIKYGKILLPSPSVKNTQVGKVLHVGDKVKSTKLQPGVVVIFDHLAGQLIDEHMLVLKEDDIYAYVDDYEGQVE